MSFLKDKNRKNIFNQFEAIQTVDEIIYLGIKNKFDTDIVNFTWTNTELWYKMIRLKNIDLNRRLKFPSIAISRIDLKIDWDRPNVPVDTGSMYTLLKKMIQRPQYNSTNQIYEPAVWLVTQCLVPLFMKMKYTLSVVTNMQQDYNSIVQDVLSIFLGGRTYMIKLLDFPGRIRRLYNRYGVHLVVTGLSSSIINGLDSGGRLFNKLFEITANSYLYRNVLKYTTKTKNIITFTLA